MSVDDVEAHPELASEREWLAEAVRPADAGARHLPRRAAAGPRPGRRGAAGGGPGDRLRPGRVPDPDDPMLGALAPETTVLHWHGDVFDLPEGARSLASSAATEHQAFRYGNAWGVLFHPEADAAMVEAWLEVPEMVMEAGRAIGLGASGLLPSQAEDARSRPAATHDPRLPRLRRTGRSPLDWTPRGGRSSAGRAPGCGPGGRRFESGRPPLIEVPANGQLRFREKSPTPT